MRLSNSESPVPLQQDPFQLMGKLDSKLPWLHMVAIAFAYAILIFLATVLLEKTNYWSMYFGFALLIPVLFIFGTWAAFGTGTTWLRVAVFSLLGPCLCLAAVCGLYALRLQANFGDDLLSVVKSTLIVLCVSFSFCIASQVPFWFFRVLFGWQFISVKGNWSEQKFSIRDVFLLTAMFAFAFAAPRFAATLYFEAIADSIQVGYTEYVESVDPEGNAMVEEVLVTEDNINEVRKNRSRQSGPFKNQMSLVVIINAALVGALALFFVPVVLFTLRKSGGAKGVFFAIVYLLSLFAVVALLLLFAYGGTVNWTRLIPYLVGLGWVVVISAMLPLLVSRMLGVRLATNRDFRERRNEKSLETNPH